jgi:NADH dehydrogenase [ubiquinone] 1 alpha subcomplex assembly factor 6
VSELSYCAEQVRQFDYDRFICTLFAPPEEREALAAVYAFNVEVARIRESVRQPLLGHMRLRWWTDALDAVFTGCPPRHEIAVALSGAVRRFGLDRHLFDQILETRAFDMDDQAPADVEALIAYAEGTAASLGLLSLRVLGAEGDAAARAAARDVGIGWALTGLLRTVPFHAKERRIYLPASLNRQAGLDVFQLFEMRSPQALRTVVAAVADCADAHLDAARAARRQVPRAALPALLPATLADGYLRRLQRARYNPFAASVQKPGPLRLAKLAVNAARGRY